jgi:AcrR family transcriptional regulator
VDAAEARRLDLSREPLDRHEVQRPAAPQPSAQSRLLGSLAREGAAGEARAGLRDARHLAERAAEIRHLVQAAGAVDLGEYRVAEGQGERVAAHQQHVVEALAAHAPRGARQHRRGDVEADDEALRTDAARELHREVALAARDVEHEVALGEREALFEIADLGGEIGHADRAGEAVARGVVEPGGEGVVEDALGEGRREIAAEEVEDVVAQARRQPLGIAGKERGRARQRGVRCTGHVPLLVSAGSTGRISPSHAQLAPRIPMSPARSRRSPAKPRKRPLQRRSRETVRAILEAAARIFEERGIAAATTDAIAERAGVSVGSLYQYFPNKESLLATLSACHLLAAHAALLPAWELLDADAPAGVAIPALVHAMIESHAHRPRLHRILFADAPLDSDQLRALIAEHAANCARIARWIAARPELRVADPALAARVGFDALTALAHGFALDRRVGTVARREQELEILLRRYWVGTS